MVCMDGDGGGGGDPGPVGGDSPAPQYAPPAQKAPDSAERVGEALILVSEGDGGGGDHGKPRVIRVKPPPSDDSEKS